MIFTDLIFLLHRGREKSLHVMISNPDAFNSQRSLCEALTLPADKIHFQRQGDTDSNRKSTSWILISTLLQVLKRRLLFSGELAETSLWLDMILPFRCRKTIKIVELRVNVKTSSRSIAGNSHIKGLDHWGPSEKISIIILFILFLTEGQFRTQISWNKWGDLPGNRDQFEMVVAGKS